MRPGDSPGGWLLTWSDQQLAGLITALSLIIVPIVVAIIRRPSFTMESARKLYADLRESDRILAERDECWRRIKELEHDIEEKDHRIVHLESLLYNKDEKR
jgi:uncharacterized protein YoxC